jgi:REP element-mobilizing transposase RayT
MYHVTTRSAGPIAMFIDGTDRMDFLDRLAKAAIKFGWSCRAFCLMTTHYHLLLYVPTNTLQPGMQRLNGEYAQEFNRQHGRSGHLHGDRYSAAPVETERHLLAAFRYVVRNPVRAGLCASPADWLWSSYRGTAGMDVGFPFVDDAPIRAYFSRDTEKALRLLRDFSEVPLRGLSPVRGHAPTKKRSGRAA